MIVYKDFDLTNYNSYRVKAICKKAYFPENEEDVVSLYKQKKGFILLGSGHNIILSKQYYNSSFIIFNGNFNKIEVDTKNSTIMAQSGASILNVSEIAEQNSLSGVEFYYDIPSSVGGAVVMNAGTKEGETKNILKKVRYFDLNDMEIKEKLNKELDLEYRNSMFQKQKNKVILKVWFQLSSGNPLLIREIMESSKKRRWEKQPREFPNSGSVFKRPPGKFVGPMLDELDLKGVSVGGAQVSKKHSGFIVNKGGATGEDILNLIKQIQEKVFIKFNINLEVEQRII